MTLKISQKNIIQNLKSYLDGTPETVYGPVFRTGNIDTKFVKFINLAGTQSYSNTIAQDDNGKLQQTIEFQNKIIGELRHQILLQIL